MIEVKKEGILMSGTGFGFEDEGVLNPATIAGQEFIHLFYRAVSKGNYSSIGYCKLKGPLVMAERASSPIISPEFDYESHGVEDPRITKIDDIYYLTYTAFDGVNALGALATSTDLEHFEKKGVIVPQLTFPEFKELIGLDATINEKYTRYNLHSEAEVINGRTVLVWDKNLFFFPGRINGKMYFMHRIRPDIQIASINELSDLTPEYWADYMKNFKQHIVMVPKYPHEVSYIGGGCPPVKTDAGWVLIYHGVHDTVDGYVYSACAALLDLENPQIEIARLPYPLFKPDHKWELLGQVNNVCFPTGTILEDDQLYIYYGAADDKIGCASVNLQLLINELLLNTLKHEA